MIRPIDGGKTPEKPVQKAIEPSREQLETAEIVESSLAPLIKTASEKMTGYFKGHTKGVLKQYSFDIRTLGGRHIKDKASDGATKAAILAEGIFHKQMRTSGNVAHRPRKKPRQV